MISKIGAAHALIPAMNDFQTALSAKLALEAEAMEASQALQAFPRGPMGLTPDDVRASPEWKQAKARYELANARSKAFNGPFLKRWKKEYRAFVMAKRHKTAPV